MNGLKIGLLIGTATTCLWCAPAFAQFSPKTSGCPDEVGDIGTALTPPSSRYTYAYFCITEGGSTVIKGLTYYQGCNVVKSGPLQAKFPMSEAYVSSEPYTKYLAGLQELCTKTDPNAGVMGRFYIPPPNSNVPTPQKCDIINGAESCSTLITKK